MLALRYAESKNGALYPNGAQKGGASPFEKPAKPVKFKFHLDGSISVRVNGKWFHGQELDQRLYLSWPGEVRRRVMKRLVLAEYRDGRPRLGDVVVTCKDGG